MSLIGAIKRLHRYAHGRLQHGVVKPRAAVAAQAYRMRLPLPRW